MKSICDLLRKGLILSAALIMCAVVAQAQDNVPQRDYYTGVGPVVNGSVDISKLPGDARDFIKKHIAGTVIKCDREYLSGEYDVTMSTGVEIEFDKHGKVIEIDAADNSVLGKDVIKAVANRELYQELADRDMLDNIESIKHTKKGYSVDFRNGTYDEGLFSEKGELIVLYED